MQSKAKRYYSSDRIRKSLLHYLFGRGAASLASFASAILLIRVFSVSTYAAYTALSGLFYSISILTGLGIERVIPRFLPEYRQKGNEKSIRVCIRWANNLRMAATVLLIIPLYFLADLVFEYLSINHDSQVMIPFCAYVLTKTFAEQYGFILQAMLYQREATIGNLIEFFFRLFAIFACYYQSGSLNLDNVFWIFTVCCVLRILYSLFYLSRYVGKENAIDEPIDPIRLFRIGWHNYVTLLMNLPIMSGTSRILAASFLSHFQTAILGFSYTLTEVLMRYLPATLLLGLIEPVFMARYTENRNFENLNQMASIVVKINLFILAPVTAWMAFNGGPLIALVSSGKYADAALPIAILMIVMMIDSHEIVLMLIANAVEKSGVLVSASWTVIILFPLYVALIFYFGVIGQVSGILFLACARNLYTVLILHKLGYHYRVDVKRITRIILGALTSILIANGFNLIRNYFDLKIPALVNSLIIASIAGILYLIIMYLIKAFSNSERDLLNRFSGRKLVVW